MTKERPSTILGRISDGVKSLVFDKTDWTPNDDSIRFDTGLGRIEFAGLLDAWFIVRVNIATDTFNLSAHIFPNDTDASITDISLNLPRWDLLDTDHLLWSIKGIHLVLEDEVEKVIANAIISFYKTYKKSTNTNK